MTTWNMTIEEGTRLFSPVGLRLVDELTGEPPLGSVQATLDIQGPGGAWRRTDIPAVMTPSAVIIYPGLERHAQVAGLPARQYRVRLTADLYIPHYRINADGIGFTAWPYNDQNPPAHIVKSPTDTPLVPAVNYPFSAEMPVLRGRVVDAAGNGVPDAYVTQGNNERAVSDARGEYALPLRWVAPNTLVTIDAADQRTGRTGQIDVLLPTSLGSSQNIPIH
jgi:hypothetical protein